MAYIHNSTPVGLIMDAREYDRIADLLMQIRRKYGLLGQTTVDRHTIHIDDDCSVFDLIEFLLMLNDNLGQFDAKGWL